MKHLILWCLVALLGWSCKRTVDPNGVEPIDENEIQISASSATSLEGAGRATNNVVPDDFDRFSAIGLFTQLRSDVGTTTLMADNKANARFNYAAPIWTPQASTDRLRYHETDPIVVYGYFPQTNLKGARIQQKVAPHLFDFWPAKNQSTMDSVTMSNLMWCRADNSGQGYLRQGAPISMVFSHLMCRVSIYLRVVDSKPQVGQTPTKVHLRQLTLGPNPNFSPATLGQVGVKGVLNVLASEYGVGTASLLQTTEVGSIGWDDGGLTRLEIPLTDLSTPATFVTDLLLLPFEAKENENLIRFVLDYPEFYNSNNHPFYTKIPAYTGLAAPPTVADGNKWRFGRNDHVKMTVTIDLSTSYITLTATIAPWLVGSGNDLTGEPE